MHAHLLKNIDYTKLDDREYLKEVIRQTFLDLDQVKQSLLAPNRKPKKKKTS
jgi:hypothetical protein